MPRQEKITFGDMRASGASRIIVHCGDYKCGHSVTMYPALWPDKLRLSDLEERFVCTAVTAAPMSGRCLSQRAWARTPCHDGVARGCGFLCSHCKTAGFDFVDNQASRHEACFHKNVER